MSSGFKRDYFAADMRILGNWMALSRIAMHLTIRLPLRQARCLRDSCAAGKKMRPGGVSSSNGGNVVYDGDVRQSKYFQKMWASEVLDGEVFSYCLSAKFKSHFQHSIFLYSPITCCEFHQPCQATATVPLSNRLVSPSTSSQPSPDIAIVKQGFQVKARFKGLFESCCQRLL